MKTNIDRVYSKMPQKKHNFEKHKVKLRLIVNEELNKKLRNN